MSLNHYNIRYVDFFFKSQSSSTFYIEVGIFSTVGKQVLQESSLATRPVEPMKLDRADK